MRNKKAVIWSVVGCLALLSLLWFALNVRSVIQSAFEAEKHGHAYRLFFIAVAEYTQESGRLPKSFDELLPSQVLSEHWVTGWQEDTAYLQELIGPDFAVSPRQENLSAFVPGYETKAAWADYHCEFFWERIVENCDDDP